MIIRKDIFVAIFIFIFDLEVKIPREESEIKTVVLKFQYEKKSNKWSIGLLGMQFERWLMVPLHTRKELATLGPNDPCCEGDLPCRTRERKKLFVKHTSKTNYLISI